MASELNHHVGHSRANECWFIRFYPYQTEQQALDAITAFTRPAPAATDTGLVTVHTQARFGPNDVWRNEVFVGERSRITERRELVTRSQAEDILAAKDTEIAGLTRVIGELVATIPVSKTLSASATNKALIEYFKELHADHAAKDARINFLERVWKKAENRAEALEAKLSAAEKALEPFANAADGRKSKSVTGSVCFSQHYLLAARAVLGGKPS